MATTEDTNAAIEGILEKLIAGHAPENVILFGSHAYGDPRPDSEIDLLMEW